MLLFELGANPASLLADVGLPPNALEDPENRVPYAALGQLLSEAARRTHCPHLGLLAGRMWRPSDLGLLGELALNSPTVGQALRNMAAHQHLNSGGGMCFLLERTGTVDFGYAIYHPDVQETDQIYDTVIAILFGCLREMCGPAWLPTEILMPRARLADVAPYRRFFKAPLRFDAEMCAIRFAAPWMSHPIQNADPRRLQAAQECANRRSHGELVEQVFRALRLLLLNGRNSGDEVASMLSIHRRTLNRRLKAQGTSFRHVLDEVRFEVARQLLADSNIALDDVAATLGYAGVSPFMRTFRRWTGTTPAQWRRAAVAARRLERDLSQHVYAHAPAIASVASRGSLVELTSSVER